MVVQLSTGELKVVDEDDHIRYFAISGGFLEVAGFGEVNVAADAAEASEDIDVPRAQAAEARAKARMESRSENVDDARAQAALQRALNRLRVAGKRR
jgi:F-type H+-transporting ATPase subunit epsilon